MRTIKFRAWDKNKQVVYFTLDDLADNNEGYFLNGVNYFELENITQFTGLYDKNGKEIYEGDIVKGIVMFPQLTTYDTDENSNFNMCGEVFYSHSGYSLKCVQSLCQEDREGMVNYFDFIGGDEQSFREMEIIGNIYQNPELLQ